LRSLFSVGPSDVFLFPNHGTGKPAEAELAKTQKWLCRSSATLTSTRSGGSKKIGQVLLVKTSLIKQENDRLDYGLIRHLPLT
jgi:hypothetical protein